MSIAVAAVMAASAAVPRIELAAVPHLVAWEKAMKGADNFYAEGTLKRTNLLLKKEYEYTVSIACQKPNLARMRIDRKPLAGSKANPDDYTAYIWDGKSVFEYDGLAKRVIEIRPVSGQGAGGGILDRIAAAMSTDNLLLQLLLGNLRPEHVVRRFEVKLAKADDHYVYLDIRPLTARDKGEFESMTLVLFKPAVQGMGYLPRTVAIRKPNGAEEEEWDFPHPAVNAAGIGEEMFRFVTPPAGWKVTRLADLIPLAK